MNEGNHNLKNIKNYDLFLLYKETKNIEIRNQIFEKYKYIADIVSKKYNNRGIEQDDIYQISCMALLYAVERFDVTKGFEFSSFATPTMLGEVKRYFRDKGWFVKIPRKIQEISQKVNKASGILSNNLQRTPSIKEIAQYLKYTEEEVLEAIEAGKMFTSQSLNISVDMNDEENELTLMDIIGEEDDYFEKIENRDFIEKSLQKLNKLEKQILEKRYFENETQNQISKELNISQMTVSRIEKKALDKLREEIVK